MTNFLYRAITSIFVAVVSLILTANILFSRGYQSIQLSASPLFKMITLILSLASVALLFWKRRQISIFFQKLPKKKTVAGLLIFGCLLQIAAILFLSVRPSWDFGAIVGGAARIVRGEKLTSYFVYYPNNLLAAWILALIGKTIFPTLVVYQFFNMIFISLSEYLIYRIAAKLAGPAAARISLLIAVLFFPYIFYAPIVYTDTFSLIFLLLPLNMLITEDGHFKKDPHTLLTVSVLFALGFLLKGLLIIFVIALALTLLILMQGWNKAYVLLPFAVLFAVQHLFLFAVFATGTIDRDRVGHLEFPAIHWIRMGQNRRHAGKYLESDAVHTRHLLQKYPRAKVTQIEMGELEQRVRAGGVSGNARFLTEKTAETWTDGTYYSLNVLKRKPFHPRFIRYLTHNPLQVIVQGYARIQLFVLFAGVLLFGIQQIRRRPLAKNSFLFFSMLSVIGFFFFLILWETRSRYLVSLTPLLIILSTLGYFDAPDQLPD